MLVELRSLRGRSDLSVSPEGKEEVGRERIMLPEREGKAGDRWEAHRETYDMTFKCR